MLLPDSVLLLAWMVTLAVMAGRSPARVIVASPLVKVMVLPVPPALESRMAWRSEPAPLLAFVVTTKASAQAGAAVSAVAARRAVANVAESMGHRRWPATSPQIAQLRPRCSCNQAGIAARCSALICNQAYQTIGDKPRTKQPVRTAMINS